MSVLDIHCVARHVKLAFKDATHRDLIYGKTTYRYAVGASYILLSELLLQLWMETPGR